MSEEPQFDEAEDQKYKIKTHLKFVDEWVKEEHSGRNYQRRLVIFVPDSSTDNVSAFFNAWMPRGSDAEYVEMICTMGSPVNGPARIALLRGHDKRSQKPYLFLMSKGVEDIFLKSSLKSGDVFVVTIESQDEELEGKLNDQIVDTDLDIKGVE